MDLSGCTNYFPPLGRLVVLNSWFGYTSSNPFITHAFYIARDRSYWQRRDTLAARRHLDSSWAPWHSSAMAILHTHQRLFIYRDFNSLPAAAVLWVCTGKEKKEKETLTQVVPPHAAPAAWDWRPNTNAGPPRTLGSPLERAGSAPFHLTGHGN